MKTTFKKNTKNINSLKDKLNNSIYETGLSILEKVKNDEVVPYDTGNLQETSTVTKQKDKTVIRFNADYAEEVYYATYKMFKTINNANAQAMWMESFTTGNNKEFVFNTFKVKCKEILK